MLNLAQAAGTLPVICRAVYIAKIGEVVRGYVQRLVLGHELRAHVLDTLDVAQHQTCV